MPRMRVIAGPLSLEGDLQERLQPLPRDRLPSTVRVLAQLGIAVDVLHVVQVFEPVEQLDDPLRGIAVHGDVVVGAIGDLGLRSEEHTSELQSLMRISYAVFCLKKTIS